MSAAVAAAAAAAILHKRHNNNNSSSSSVSTSENSFVSYSHSHSRSRSHGRYESLKLRDWNMFRQYLRNHHRPPLNISRCSEAHVMEFLRYLDGFGKNKVHSHDCTFFGQTHPPPSSSCSCPLRQVWGSLDAIVGRLSAAFEENGGQPETNPFRGRAVRLYLKEVRDSQANG